MEIKISIDAWLTVKKGNDTAVQTSLLQGLVNPEEVPAIKQKFNRILDQRAKRGGDLEMEIIITETTVLTDKASLQEVVNVEQMGIDIQQELLNGTKIKHGLK